MAKIYAKIRGGSRLSENITRFGAIGAGQAQRLGPIKKGVGLSQLIDLRSHLVRGEVTAGKGGIRCPAAMAVAKLRPDLRQCRLGKLAIGGDLAAKDVQKRRAAGVIQFQDIIAGRSRCRAGAVIIKRANAGEAPDDVIAGQGRCKIL